MSASQLAKLPTLEELLAQKPRDIREYLNPTPDMATDLPWLNKFDAAVMRKYVGEWFKWYMDGQRTGRSLAMESFDRTLEDYLHIAGQHLPWFREAVSTMINADPLAHHPMITLYLSAKIETLGSLEIFQGRFLQESSFKDANADVCWWINEKIATAAAHNDPPQPFLFSAIANAYEHVFSFVTRMVVEFNIEYQTMPTAEEFQQLTPQLIKLLGKEALLSRSSNIVLEEYFHDCESFFSFQKNTDRIELGIHYPTEAEQAAISARLESDRGSFETRMRFVKSMKPEHYGCHAAFASHEGSNPINFVFDKVVKGFQTALWAADNPALQPVLPFEPFYRERVASALKIA